jgi:hypothetical protein
MFCHLPIAINESYVLFRQATVVQQSDELLHWQARPLVWLHQRLVAHEESAHQLQHRDFKGEVEGGDYGDWSVREPVRSGELTFMIAGVSDALSKESDSVASVVLEEVDHDSELSSSLGFTLGTNSLNAPYEKVEYFFISHCLDHIIAHISKHQVSLLIPEGVV